MSAREANRRYRKKQLFDLYGIDHQEYDRLFRLQKGRCAICGQQETAKARGGDDTKLLAIDHDHVTGEIRGLLCQRCNQGLGQFQDNPLILRKAATYLEKHRGWVEELCADFDLPFA